MCGLFNVIIVSFFLLNISLSGSARLFMLQPKYLTSSFLGTGVPSAKVTWPAGPKWRYSHLRLLSLNPYLSPSFSMAARSLVKAASSSDMQIVSSAYQISSVSIPCTLWGANCKVSFLCISAKSTDIRTMNK